MSDSLNVEFEESTISHSEDDRKLIRKHTYKPKKARIRCPLPLQRVFANKKVVKNHYFSAGTKINDDNERPILHEPSPFNYPSDLEEFSFKVMSKEWREILRKKELKYKYNERNSYRSRQQLDVLNRLYAKEPQIDSMVAILDIYPEYFTSVEGRPIEKSFRLKEYIADAREVLKTKIITGYREDEILLIDEVFENEQKIINEIKKQLQKYVDTFEAYLYNDHTTSMNLIRQAEKESQLTIEKNDLMRELSKSYGAIKASVYGLEEKWRNSRMYQRFLYLVSPMEWRRQYDYYLKMEEQADASIKSDTTIFGRYRLGSMGDILTLDELIEQFLEDIACQEEPQLYFTEPKQLLKAFNFIEIQNLNSLLHTEELAVPLENVHFGMMRAKEIFEIEISNLQEKIDGLEGGILWEEERAKSLEELALELINGEFKKVTADADVLNLYVFVEDVFENRIASNDTDLEVTEMMRAIEMKYRHYLLQLDALPQELVYKAESECYREEARMMKIAIQAAKKVAQIERLTRKLNIALGPPFVKTVKDMKWRSPPVNPPVYVPPPPRPLTYDEKEFLNYFTDYCKLLDETKVYGIDVSDKPKDPKDIEKVLLGD